MPTENKVRIIGGKWKKTPLTVLNAEGLRPTGDRQRETIFNWLNHLFEGFENRRSLDLFAGTGALSFEWISRGGQLSVLVEKNRTVAAKIKENIRKLNAGEVMLLAETDCFTSDLVLSNAPYDMIFIDPPFARNLQEKALELSKNLLKPRGIVYIESPKEIGDDCLNAQGWTALRRAKAGQCHLLLVEKTEEPS